MRQQFFFPDRFRGDVPLRSQMLLTGGAPKEYDETRHQYWSEPFKFFVHDKFSVLMVVRNASIYLPITRDPETRSREHSLTHPQSTS